MDSHSPSQQSAPADEINWKMLMSTLWVVTLLITGFGGYLYGRSTTVVVDPEKKVVLGSTNESPTPIEAQQQTSYLQGETPTPITTLQQKSSGTCKKTGFAQKWEYLKPYTVKQNDSYQDIAKTELHDATRVNEITQINGIGQVVVGSTLYLPPDEVTKSSGNLKEVYGKIIEKTTTSWHVNFSADGKGQGILFPSFWFDSIPDASSYKIGDCVKIFFDDGYKIYTLTKQG